MGDQKITAPRPAYKGPERKSYPPLAADMAHMEKVRALLEKGGLDELRGMGAAARPALFRLLNDTGEEHPLRLSAAEAILEGHRAAVRAQDRALCLLLTSPTAEIPELLGLGYLPMMAIIKNRDEIISLRVLAVEALGHALVSEKEEIEFSVIFELTGMLTGSSENAVLRAHIAFELAHIGEKCQGAKLKMIERALERAAQDEEDLVRSQAENALELIRARTNGEFVADDNPTQPLFPKPGK